jgi:uncharacterized protein with HEPN domain
MLPLEIRKYLFDISEAAELIVRFTEGKTYDDFHADRMLRSAVERQFEIIGEALNKALQLDPGLGSSISDSGRIIAFRHRLIHGYATVSDEVVWGRA